MDRLRNTFVDVLLKVNQPIEVEYNEEKLKYKVWEETVYEQPPNLIFFRRSCWIFFLRLYKYVYPPYPILLTGENNHVNTTIHCILKVKVME